MTAKQISGSLSGLLPVSMPGGSTSTHQHAWGSQGECGSKTKSGRKRSSLQGKQQQQQQQAQQLEEVLDLQQRLEEATLENTRLKNRLAYIQSGLQLLDYEQAAASSVDAGSTCSQRTRAEAFRDTGQQSLLGHKDLPDPGAWDARWDRRVQGLSLRDMLLLHRSWLQDVALLLPKAELLGKGSAEQQRLLLLMDRYMWFNQSAMVLAPDTWAQRSNYNLETMQQAVGTSQHEVVHQLLNIHKADKHTAALVQQYAAASRQLQHEYQILGVRHRELQPSAACSQPTLAAQAYLHQSVPFRGSDCQPSALQHPPGPHSAHNMYGHLSPSAPFGSRQMAGFHGSIGSSSYSDNASIYHTDAAVIASLAVDETLALMQGNLWRQKVALRQCLHAVWEAVREDKGMSIANAYVTAYPLIIDIADMVEAAANTALAV